MTTMSRDSTTQGSCGNSSKEGGENNHRDVYREDIEQGSKTQAADTDNNSSVLQSYSEEELEKLGKARPDAFNGSLWLEVMFCFSIVMSQVLSEYYVSGFNIIIPTLVKEFDIPDGMAVWPASAFSLVIASVLLVFGRLADMVGGFPIYVGGLAWLALWSLITGFSKNRLMLIFCRALAGLGPAAYLPTSLMLLANVYRPGPRKNMVFSIYGTCAVIGFFAGIFFSGVCAEYLTWAWYFWIGAIITAITATTSYFFIPSDSSRMRKNGAKMDWWGVATIVPAFILIVFAITDSSHAPNGWKTPYIYVCFVLGWLCIAAGVYVEGWVAQEPLLPPDLFRVKHMKPLVFVLLCFYGTFGVFLLYGTLYMTHVMGATPLQIVAWCIPMVVGGLLFPVTVAHILHRVSGTILLSASLIAWVGSGLLFAVMPEGASYWAFVFPAMVCATTGIDITFNVTNIFITTKQPSHRQGIAGALINSVLHLGIAVFLGFGDVLQAETSKQGQKKSYQNVFWYQTAGSILVVLISVFFVRIEAAKSELTEDERRQLETELEQRAQN